jgi:hypothetical protein
MARYGKIMKYTIVIWIESEYNKGISTMVNATVLNFGKRYKDDLRVIFDQWPKLHLGLDALSNQEILKGIYSLV